MRVETLGDGRPEIAVVGGIHGDEPAGVRAVERLMADRPEVARPVKLVVANEEAIERGERYVEADLNRSFPGRADGRSHEIRLAHELGEELRDCVTLALHTTQSYGGMFALVDEVRELAREVCPRLSIDAVVETGHAEGRIFEVAPDTIEVECGYQGSDRATENAHRVVREFLAATGALPDEETPHQTDLPVFRLGDPVPKTAAEEYEVFVENFEEVVAGERIAAADGEAVVAEENFHPVLLSAYGYEDVFGYTAERVGTLSG
ncbi:M14 family metallopeptidase [Halosimplex halophilum]|uniref:succinylglutamate desuccinylase/aspartoacylase domain-containing protein n=1 Tax=Halosimplex halophilum TaxID=2559572 RepID=UPI00107F0249|nr:succinylglutamate desuccinylase/aspartoacylase family protein [Halosimplex halophilum]